MSTRKTATLTITIDAPLQQVAADLADPATHAQWATEFFSEAIEPLGDGSYRANVPRMGGEVRYKIAADPDRGLLDLYLAPAGAPFGEPIPVRLIPNGSGVDVLWTLAQPTGVPDDGWQKGLESMQRELASLKERHEAPTFPDGRE